MYSIVYISIELALFKYNFRKMANKHWVKPHHASTFVYKAFIYKASTHEHYLFSDDSNHFNLAPRRFLIVSLLN